MSVKKFVLAMIGVLLAGGALAQDSVELTSSVYKQVLVETDDGSTETQLVAADNVLPGDRLVFRNTIRNISAEPAESIVITNPIEEELVYVAGSAEGEGMAIEFSVDGGQSFAAANALRVVDNGIERPATTKDYTHVRWVMQTELAAGAEGTTSFAADVE